MQDLVQSGLNISVNGEYTHHRNRLGNPFCWNGTVVGEGNLEVFVLRFNAGFLLVETCQPCVAIGVGGVEFSKEGLRAFTFEVDSTNLGCQCMEVVGQVGALE